MGFTPERKQYRLVFEDPAMAGLVVIATSPPMGVVVNLTSISDTDVTNLESVITKVPVVDKMFGYFADALVSWNLEDAASNPVPTTKDGLYTQDMDFIMEVIRAWVQATTHVADPLSGGSSSGKPAQVASIPTETLSPSLAS